MNISTPSSQFVQTSTRPEMWPVAFGPLAGWLHQRAGMNADTGVVLVSALGRDERCAFMPMRLLADRFAAAGFPTLRYDHLGEGDSLALPDPEDDALVHWLKGIDAAIALLREQTGVQRVVLAGVRMGASLATLAASRADGLILMAPVLNGRSWVRRARFSSAAADQSKTAADDSALDTDGLTLSRATAMSVATIDLLHQPVFDIPVFLAAQNKLVSNYGAGLAGQDVAFSQSDFPGFEAMFLDAHSNLPPNLVFQRASLWLQSQFGRLSSWTPRLLEPPKAPVELHPPGAIERPVKFGDGLRGVLCEAETLVPDAPAILFFNTGGDPRCGVGGFATTVARELARRGVASLRFDFAGLGNSPMQGAEVRSHIFETSRDADLEAAVGLLTRYGHRRVVAVGVCAGAYHAFRLAMRDSRVVGLFAVSPVKLVWRPGDTLAFGRRTLTKSTNFYTQALIDPGAWKRVLARQVDVGVIVRSLLDRVQVRLLSVWSHLRGASPLREMEAFSRRGGQACFLMGLKDASVDELGIYFGANAAKLQALAGASVHVFPDMDHGLTHAESRNIALAKFLDWMNLKTG